MMDEIIEFFVPGIPATSGSKKAFVNPKTGRAIVVPDNPEKQNTWMSDVKYYAQKAFNGIPVKREPFMFVMTFFFPRPQGHYGTGRNAGKVKPSAPKRPTGRPDLTKLTRAAEDALAGVIWTNDSQVVDQTVSKQYGDRPGVSVAILRLP
jgi:Holliday junction resolvase RusA-like endonuclease